MVASHGENGNGRLCFNKDNNAGRSDVIYELWSVTHPYIHMMSNVIDGGEEILRLFGLFVDELTI